MINLSRRRAMSKPDRKNSHILQRYGEGSRRGVQPHERTFRPAGSPDSRIEANVAEARLSRSDLTVPRC